MIKRLDFSTKQGIEEIACIIKDRSKRIVYNIKDHFFEFISIKEPLSLDQTEEIEVFQDKIQDLAGIIHLRLEDLELILKSLRSRIEQDSKKKLSFFNFYLKKRNLNEKSSLIIYQALETFLTQIIAQLSSKRNKKIEILENLLSNNRKEFLNTKFSKLNDFQCTSSSDKKFISKRIEIVGKNNIEENIKEKTQVIFNNVSYIQILNDITEDLYILSKDNILVYESFRKKLLSECFPEKENILEKEHTNVFEYNPSIEELNMDIQTFFKENFYDFSFILKLLLKISLEKDKKESFLLKDSIYSTKVEWFLHKIQLVSKKENIIFFNILATLLSPIKVILEQPSLLKQEKIKQDIQEEIVSLKEKINSLKTLSYYHWEICILNLFEEWIFDNQELLKSSLYGSLEYEKKTSLLLYFRDFLRRKKN